LGHEINGDREEKEVGASAGWEKGKPDKGHMEEGSGGGRKTAEVMGRRHET